MAEKNVHTHHGRSSEEILSSEEVLNSSDLKFGDIFLDAGCGDGHISIEASKIVGEQGKVYALDVYPESIETVKAKIHEDKLTNVEAILADITDDIPLDANSVDHALMANVLHGFVEEKDVEPVMKNINRVIKPGGIFSVVEFRKVENSPGPPFDVKISPKQVTDILFKYGFDVTETREIGRFHYIVNGLKKS